MDGTRKYFYHSSSWVPTSWLFAVSTSVFRICPVNIMSLNCFWKGTPCPFPREKRDHLFRDYGSTWISFLSKRISFCEVWVSCSVRRRRVQSWLHRKSRKFFKKKASPVPSHLQGITMEFQIILFSQIRNKPFLDHMTWNMKGVKNWKVLHFLFESWEF